MVVPTYVENIRNGKSTIECMVCGETVTNVTRHEREHALLDEVSSPPSPGQQRSSNNDAT